MLVGGVRRSVVSECATEFLVCVCCLIALGVVVSADVLPCGVELTVSHEVCEDMQLHICVICSITGERMAKCVAGDEVTVFACCVCPECLVNACVVGCLFDFPADVTGAELWGVTGDE